MDPYRSVQHLGDRDPASTLDFNRRVKENGVIDLVTSNSNAGVVGVTKRKRKQTQGEVFSVPGGKRTKKILHTTNKSNYCSTLQNRWDQGAFRWVHKGRYTIHPDVPGHDGGPQNGQLCVLKEFKTGSVYEESFFCKDINAVEKADDIIWAFNNTIRPTNQHIKGCKPVQMNKPQVWEDVYPDSTGRKKKKLVEPMLEGNFLKFNSNSGYSTNGSEYMQALSHFSYHHTGGKYLLCDLQGGHYEDCYVLTDPVVMSSENTKEYGAGDLGSEGIDNFFHHHSCNRFCNHNWMKPRRPQASDRITRSAGTTFSLTLGTRQSDAERKKKLAQALASNIYSKRHF